MQLKFDSTLSKHQSEKEAWDSSLQNVEETWRCSAIIFLPPAYMHISFTLFAELQLINLNVNFTVRCEALERQNEECSTQNLEKEVYELKLQCKKLKVVDILWIFWPEYLLHLLILYLYICQEEQRSFHDLADKMIEEKDKEISRLLDDNENLRQLLDSRPSVWPSLLYTNYIPTYKSNLIFL